MGRVTKKSIANRTDSNTYFKNTYDWKNLNTGVTLNWGTSSNMLSNLTTGLANNITIREVKSFVIE